MSDDATSTNNYDEYFEQRSYLEIVERQFRRNNLAMWGLRIVGFLVLVAIFAPFLASNKPLLFHGYRYKLYLETYDQLVYAHADLAGLGRGGKPTVVPGLFPKGKSLKGIADVYRTEVAQWDTKNPSWKQIRDVSFGKANAPLNKLRRDLEEAIPSLEEDADWARGARDVAYLKKQNLTADLTAGLDKQMELARANLEEAYALRTEARKRALFQQLRILRGEVSKADREAIDEFQRKYEALITKDLHRKTDKDLEPFDELLMAMRKRLNPQPSSDGGVTFAASTSSPALRQLGWLDLFFIPFVLLWVTRRIWSFHSYMALSRWVRLRRQLVTTLVLSVAASTAWGLLVPEFNDTTDYKKGMTDGSLYCAWRVMAPIPYGLNENRSVAKYRPPWWWRAKPQTDSPSQTVTSADRKTLQAPTVALDWAANGGTIAAATYDGAVRLLDARSGMERASLKGRVVSWSPDGGLLAIGGRDDGSVLVVDDQGESVVSFAKAHGKPSIALGWSSDGRYLASGALDGGVRVFDIDDEADTTGTLLAGHAESVRALAWSPADRLLVTAAGKELRMWDPKLKTSLVTVEKHAGPITAVAWSPDGAVFATASQDTTVRMWTRGGKDSRVLKGHLGPVRSIAWAPNGRLLATGSDDRQVGLWSRYQVDPLWMLEGHRDGVATVAWSGDGSHLASVDAGEEARLWTVPEGEAARDWTCKAVLTTATEGLKKTLKKEIKNLGPKNTYGAVTIALKAKIGGFEGMEARARRSLEAMEKDGATLTPDAKARKELLDNGTPVALAKWARTMGLRTEARRLLAGQESDPEAQRALGLEQPKALEKAPQLRTVPLVWAGGDGQRLATGSWDSTVLLWKAKEAGPRKVVPGGKGALQRELVQLEYDVEALRSVPPPETAYTRFLGLLSRHHMGTDGTGRDLLTRMIWGSRISLSIGFVAVGIYVFIGIIFGALAGYFGGWIDMFISRAIEIVICFPAFFLILTVIAFVGPSVFNIMVVIGVTRWTGVARLVRGEFLRLRSQDFVVAGKALGYSNTRIIFRHVLPNALAPVLVAATFGVAAAILIESSLSFLGFGVTVPTPTWGSILSSARESWIYWWITLFPGFAIFLTVTMYNLVGEGIRDAVDPKMRQ